MSPFEVVHCYKPRMHIDLIPMKHHPTISKSTSAFASHVHDLYKEISKKIQKSNAHYKSHVDLHRRHLEFNKVDSVMIRIGSKRFSPETIKKLHASSTGPYKILDLL